MALLPLYFGYGSNLCDDDLAAWCGARGLNPLNLAAEGKAFLPDRRLAFTHRSATRDGGVLDVPPARGCAVLGVLFRVPSDRAIAALDRKEGEGHHYRRFDTVALTDDGGERPVFAYEVKDAHREPFVTPAPGYLDVVRRGYRAHGVAPDALDAAARANAHRGPVTELFVYGTLMRGENRHAALARHGATDGEPATTDGTLFDLGSYPGLVLDGPGKDVAGELYTVSDPDALFGELDAIESFRGFGAAGSLYRRAIVGVRRAGRAPVPAWTYVYSGARDGARWIATGKWRERARS